MVLLLVLIFLTKMEIFVGEEPQPGPVRQRWAARPVTPAGRGHLATGPVAAAVRAERRRGSGRSGDQLRGGLGFSLSQRRSREKGDPEGSGGG